MTKLTPKQIFTEIYAINDALHTRGLCPDRTYYLEFWWSKKNNYLHQLRRRNHGPSLEAYYMFHRKLMKHEQYDLAARVKFIMDAEADDLIRKATETSLSQALRRTARIQSRLDVSGDPYQPPPFATKKKSDVLADRGLKLIDLVSGDALITLNGKR